MGKLKGRVLIANRGEIARKIIRVCKRLELESISLYTPIEEGLPHALEADYAINLGDGPLSETYLNIDKILDIARAMNVEFIHPGYGFLSENKDFSSQVKQAGFKFVGPDFHAIDVMGDKRKSKELVEEMKGPFIPGYHGGNQEAQFLKKEALKIGYPVLVKASAGGGGKGMRLVEKEADFFEALASAKSEAKRAFNNDEVLLEKYIIEPRHIEVQIFSDSKGNHIHLYDRECSIQRRHQKIIEEAPAPHLSEETKKKMRNFSVSLAKKINYLGAGTIEFVVDKNENFYFLEMNTRLQVEHPVTEYITGTDLISWQFFVANGEELPKKQKEIISRGHSIEARLYCEDPDQGFIPQTGQLLFMGRPSENNCMLDTGYDTGDVVGVEFDPMLAKVIAYGEDRQSALAKISQALNEVGPLGPKTNFEYIKRIFNHSTYREGKVNTSFVEQYKKELAPKELDETTKALAIAASFLSSGGQGQIGISSRLEAKIPSSFRNC